MEVAEGPGSSFLDDNLHLRAPLENVADDGHVILLPLLMKLWIACQVLQLGPEARFTSLVLLHRYYYYEKPNSTEMNNDIKLVGAACILLGMKAEEEFRRLRDVINVANVLNFGLDDNDTITTTPPFLKLDLKVNARPPELNYEEYWSDKEKIVITEQKVLRVLQFDIIAGHAHRMVVLLVHDFELTQHDIIRRAWKRLNDALFYPKALTHSALVLACAAVELEANRGLAAYATVGGGDISAALCDLKMATETLKQLQQQAQQTSSS